MSKTAKWLIGIVVVLVLLQFAMPFVWQFLYPSANGYGMMGGYGMPMMRGFGFAGGMHMPMMGFGLFGGLFMWLLPLGTLILIALGIAYLWRKLTEKPQL